LIHNSGIFLRGQWAVKAAEEKSKKENERVAAALGLIPSRNKPIDFSDKRAGGGTYAIRMLANLQERQEERAREELALEQAAKEEHGRRMAEKEVCVLRQLPRSPCWTKMPLERVLHLTTLRQERKAALLTESRWQGTKLWQLKAHAAAVGVTSEQISLIDDLDLVGFHERKDAAIELIVEAEYSSDAAVPLEALPPSPRPPPTPTAAPWVGWEPKPRPRLPPEPLPEPPSWLLPREQLQWQRRAQAATAEVRAVFEQHLAPPAAELGPAQFARLCRWLNVAMKESDLAQAMMDLDTDGNGAISFDELRVWWFPVGGPAPAPVTPAPVPAPVPVPEPPEVRALGVIFRQHLALSGAAELGPTEFAQICQQLKPGMDDAQIAQAMTDMDTNGNVTISFEELRGWWLPLLAIWPDATVWPPPPPLRKLVEPPASMESLLERAALRWKRGKLNTAIHPSGFNGDFDDLKPRQLPAAAGNIVTATPAKAEGMVMAIDAPEGLSVMECVKWARERRGRWSTNAGALERLRNPHHNEADHIGLPCPTGEEQASREPFNPRSSALGEVEALLRRRMGRRPWWEQHDAGTGIYGRVAQLDSALGSLRTGGLRNGGDGGKPEPPLAQSVGQSTCQVEQILRRSGRRPWFARAAEDGGAPTGETAEVAAAAGIQVGRWVRTVRALPLLERPTRGGGGGGVVGVGEAFEVLALWASGGAEFAQLVPVDGGSPVWVNLTTTTLGLGRRLTVAPRLLVELIGATHRGRGEGHGAGGHAEETDTDEEYEYDQEDAAHVFERHSTFTEGSASIMPNEVEVALEDAGIEFDPGYGVAIIAMFDKNGSGGLDTREFGLLWDYVHKNSLADQVGPEEEKSKTKEQERRMPPEGESEEEGGVEPEPEPEPESGNKAAKIAAKVAREKAKAERTKPQELEEEQHMNGHAGSPSPPVMLKVDDTTMTARRARVCSIVFVATLHPMRIHSVRGLTLT
jgi:Ca2+-binding EF-hand superfamily protein